MEGQTASCNNMFKELFFKVGLDEKQIAPVAQWSGQLTFNQFIECSSHSRGTMGC